MTLNESDVGSNSGAKTEVDNLRKMLSGQGWIQIRVLGSGSDVEGFHKVFLTR